jgi:hypothetical protein
MARESVKMNGGVGSGRSRKSRKDQITEKKAEEMQRVAAQADDVFAKLEQERIDAETQEAEEQVPRLADFKDLVFLGRMESEIKVAGWSFTLGTLTGSEQRDLLAKIMSLDAEQRLIYAKPYTLGMALISINGTPLVPASASAGFEDPMEFICSWQDPLIERLYDEYEKLFSASKSVFTDKTQEGDLKK